MCHHSEKAHIKDRPKPKSGSKHHPVRIIITAVNSDFIQTFQRLFLTHFSVSIYSLCLLDSSETNRSKCTKLCSLWCAVMFTLRGWAQTLSNQLHGAFSWILLACFYQGWPRFICPHARGTAHEPRLVLKENLRYLCEEQTCEGGTEAWGASCILM